LTKENKIYVWGSNTFLQLGLPSSITYLSSPMIHKSYENAQPFKIICGSYNTICLSYKLPQTIKQIEHQSTNSCDSDENGKQNTEAIIVKNKHNAKSPKERKKVRIM